mmetsp:Transcript_114029/g.221483  ORF Transcript_114029/g.221483 Transcript_114029/m.221483 type:complete len:116 (-) Transcript_114029:437-784(-)
MPWTVASYLTIMPVCGSSHSDSQKFPKIIGFELAHFHLRMPPAATNVPYETRVADIIGACMKDCTISVSASPNKGFEWYFFVADVANHACTVSRFNHLPEKKIHSFRRRCLSEEV